MRIDLHSHSAASDGTDSPAELVRAARAAGLDVVALTDHDTTAGWAPATQVLPAGLTLIRGAEFSTRLGPPDDPNGRGVSVHLLGYLFDPADPALVAEQQRLVAERRRRGLAMVDLMAADGIPITREQVLQIADGAPVGRPHLGRALVAAGLVPTVTAAFADYLGHGRYYVGKADTDLRAALGLITAAGGAAVIAHPRGRTERRLLTAEVIAELAAAGLAGLEVWHPDHDEADVAELLDLTADLGLIATGSSDYHGSNKSVRLGAFTTPPQALAALIDRTSGVTRPIDAATPAQKS